TPPKELPSTVDPRAFLGLPAAPSAEEQRFKNATTAVNTPSSVLNVQLKENGIPENQVFWIFIETDALDKGKGRYRVEARTIPNPAYDDYRGRALGIAAQMTGYVPLPRDPRQRLDLGFLGEMAKRGEASQKIAGELMKDAPPARLFVPTELSGRYSTDAS